MILRKNTYGGNFIYLHFCKKVEVMKKWFACLVLVGLMVNQRSMAQEGGIVCMSGDCENGSGEAMLLLEDTMYYKGTFVNGVLEGNGRLNNPGKFIYNGEFKENSMTGKGSVSLKSGERYEGMFLNAAYEGEGTVYYKNGEKFTGIFKNSEIWSGNGYVPLSENSYYKGEIKEGKRNGEGFIQFEDGSNYKGTFFADEMSGSGTIHYSDGKYYIGEVVDGYCHGNGKLYSASNVLEFEGEWIKNESQPKVKTPYEIFSPIFNECFNGYLKSEVNGQEVYSELKICFNYNYSGLIEGTATTTFKIDGVNYIAKTKIEGRAYESDNTFYLDAKSVLQEDPLPYGLVWTHDNLKGSIFTNENKFGGYILQGKSTSGALFEILD